MECIVEFRENNRHFNMFRNSGKAASKLQLFTIGEVLIDKISDDWFQNFSTKLYIFNNVTWLWNVKGPIIFLPLTQQHY